MSEKKKKSTNVAQKINVEFQLLRSKLLSRVGKDSHFPEANVRNADERAGKAT